MDPLVNWLKTKLSLGASQDRNLLKAAEQGDAKKVDVLIRSGADVEAKNERSGQPRALVYRGDHLPPSATGTTFLMK